MLKRPELPKILDQERKAEWLKNCPAAKIADEILRQGQEEISLVSRATLIANSRDELTRIERFDLEDKIYRENT